MALPLSTPPAIGFLLPGEQSPLRFRHISADWTVLLDPETAFWALAHRNGREEENLLQQALPLFEKQRQSLKAEMTRFREKIDLSAVYINATDRCNANCSYCYIPEEDRQNGINMDVTDLRAALTKIEEYHKKTCLEKNRQPVIVFHGSEPMIVKDNLFKVIEEFSGRMRFGIQTNATLLEEEDVRFLMENRVSVGISLDSSSREKNRLAREGNKDSYRCAVKALEWFNGYPGLSVICTITRHNVNELAETLKFLHYHNVKAVLMNPVRCTAQGTEELRPGNGELFRGFTEAVKTSLDLNKTTGRKIIISDFANIILTIIAPTARRLMCDITPCGGARRFFTVMSDMSATPCGEFIGLKEFRTHNLKNDSVEEILDSPAFKLVRERVVENIEECRECLYRNLCGAPCPAEVYSQTGKLNNPSPYCEYYQKLIDFAFELIAEGEVKHLLRQEMLNGMQPIYDIAPAA
ncbi:MAG: peptide-modifying radical SAM enzyme CbpB [bacterium]